MDIASSLSPDIKATNSNKKTPVKKGKGRKRRLPGLARLLVVLVILGGLAVAAYIWQTQKAASAAQQPTITLPVTQGNLDITVQSNGNVQATREQSVTYQTTGDVVEVLVKSGDKVDAGQPLVRQTDQVQKQAVIEAEAALSTARAKLDDLKKGPTEADVVSAQAEVASAQAALNSVRAGSSAKDIADAQAEMRAAEADLATVKAGATTKQIADAQSDLKTAQAAFDQVKAGATTKQIADAQADLKTAQMDYQKVKAGATTKEIADAQADLKAAQAKYDVLLVSPSANTLKEAQSKLTAAKTKLAALKAEPKPADLSKAQLAVTEAQASLKTTQDSAALAKQTKQLAIEKTNRDLQQAQREYGTIAGQVLDDKGNFSIDPNARDYNNLYTEYWSAYNNLKDAEADQSQALADLDNTLKKEVQDVAIAQAKLDDAKKQLEVVKAGATPDELATAQLDVDSAQKALEDLTKGPASDSLATAQAAITKAQTALDQLKAGPTHDILAASEAKVVKAQTALDQLKAGPTKDELASAEADVVKARTALDQLKAGPTKDELATAQMAVDKARNNLTELQSGPTADKVAAAQATVAQKQADLQALYVPVSSSETSAAEEAVVSAQQAVDDAKTELGKTVLKAPFSGIVAAVSAEPNAKVTVGSEALTIYDESGMHLELDVNESDIQKLKVGQSSVITVDALPGQVLTGTVSQVSNVSQTNQDVVTYQVDVEFSPGTAPIKTGMSASATITVESHEAVIQVPTRALKTQGRNKTLDILYGEGKTPVTISVMTGASNSQMTEIVSCVDTNNQCLRVGDTVAVTVATSTTSTGNNAAPGAFGQQGFPVQGPGTGTRQFPRP